MFGQDLDSTLKLYERAFTLATELTADKPRTSEWSEVWSLFAESANGRGYILQHLGRMDSALLYHHTCLEISSEIGLDTLSAFALNNIGLCFYRMGKIDSALIFYKESYALRVKMGSLELAQAPLNNIAWVHQSQGNLDSALYYLTRVLEVNERTQDSAFMSNSLHSLGVNYYKRGDFSRALSFHDRSLRLREQLQDFPGISTSNSELALIYQKLGDYKSALYHLRKSIAMERVRGKKISIANGFNNLGTLFKQMGDMDSALFYLQTALELQEEADNKDGVALSLSNLGAVLETMGHPEDALIHYKRSVSLRRSIGNKGGLAISLGLLGSYYAEHGNLPLAEVTLREALEMAIQAKEEETLTTIYKNLSKVYHELGLEGKAYAMLQLYVETRAKTHSPEANLAMIRQQVDYARRAEDTADSLAHQAHVEELQHLGHIDRLKWQQARNRSWAFSIGAAMLLVGGGTIYGLDRRRRRAKYQRDATQLELKGLRAQMNPHFLYNALASINNYVLENESALASSYLTKFGRLMRMVLDNSREPTIPLAKELEALRLYMELEQLRLNGKFDYHVEVDPQLDAEEVEVPPMTIQPFVENAIWHGLAKKEGPGKLRVFIREQDRQLRITVEDDGVGRCVPARSDAGKPASLGTAITAQRLAMLSEKLGMQLGFRYLDVPVGVTVEITLPLQEVE